MTKLQKLVLLVAILASFVVLLDGTIVNVALPALAKELSGGLATQQWVVNAYLITLGACILLAGSLSDLFGRKRILTIGLIGFGVTSLLCAVTPSALFLIVARALQGIAGALLVPSSLALIIEAFRGGSESKAIGTWTAWITTATVAGPLLGGLLVDNASWRLIFAVNVLPIAYTLWLMRHMHTPEAPRNNRPRLDITGAVLCTAGLLLTVYALIEQPHYGWDSAAIWGPLAIGLTMLVLFLAHERQATQPMLPPKLFQVRNFSVGNLATTTIYGGLSLSVFLLIIFIQQVGGYSATQAGLAGLPSSIFMFLLASRFGALAGKYGPRWFMAGGPLVAAGGFMWYYVAVDASADYWTQVFPGISLFGLGLSITVAPLTAAVLADIPKQHSGIASAVNNAIARIAGLLATAAAGVIVGTTLDVAGFRRGALVMAGLLALGSVISAIGIQNNQSTPGKTTQPAA
jgi:EmrB/QacA subfamily drug resistance transporter